MLLSNRYRPNKWPFYVLVVIEFPFTVALLALFGIADPDLYRTLLWQDGANNGFNSNPNAALYAAANYRPYTTPKVWSQLYVPPLTLCARSIPAHVIISITNYNVVIVVLSMFIMLAKVCVNTLKSSARFNRYLTCSPGRYVHPARLAPTFFRHCPRHTPCALCSLNRLPSGIRYERSKASAAWPPLVHHKILLSGL
jgi:hypothetical protein